MLGDEPIRLVIWDLHETFWRGTLSEGGITEYVRDHHDIVIELARRGIISSICSKNELEPTRSVLVEHGIWDYFVMPSIDWDAKGPRLKKLVADIQLRPENVLFIDDNPGNRAEATAHVSGLRTADTDIIGQIRSLRLFKGKDDPELRRLKQYQLLQRRKSDENAAADNREFLRASHIHVAIDPNIADNLDRAIELINRTNQLNFTKLRLPDDSSLAREQLLKLANRYCHQSGLIRVWDDYGDYGFCGIYVTLTRHGVEQLSHFCFSCRILGMGVERWLYDKLGRPTFKVTSDAIDRIQADSEPVDWINQEAGGALLFAENMGETPPTVAVGKAPQQWLAPEIRLRGGCDLDALSHYMRQETPCLLMDTSVVNGTFLVRQDSTVNIALSAAPFASSTEAELSRLSLFDLDADKAFFENPQPGTLFIFSAWGDLYLPVYRHNTQGFDISVALRTVTDDVWDLTKTTDGLLDNYFARITGQGWDDEMKAQAKCVARELSENYTCIGVIDNPALLKHWRQIFSRIPADCSVAVILPIANRQDISLRAEVYHAILREAAGGFPNIALLNPTPYITGIDKLQGTYDHLDRMVYFNMYKDLERHFGRR